MDDKPVVYARLNWGNWIADCPVHGEGVAELVEEGRDFICSRCYPDIYATMKMQHPQMTTMRVSVPDLAKREAARRQAEQEGHAYRVVFPKEKQQIMAIVRRRPLRNMNWRLGETLAGLRESNKNHGVIK